MAIQGASANAYFSSEVGTIGTSWTFVKTQKLSPAKNILAYPVLQQISESGGQTQTDAYISKFTDAGVTKGGHFLRVVAKECTFIEWAVFCDHSFNNPLRVMLFF